MKELSSVKNEKYQKIYKKNLKKYKNSKVELDFLEVWVGKTCNLRCRDCLHMIPYLISYAPVLNSCIILIR